MGGTGIALPAHPHIPHPGYTLPATPYMPYVAPAGAGHQNMVVGLISVDQLSLYALFSGLRGITEVYNLMRIGNR